MLNQNFFWAFKLALTAFGWYETSVENMELCWTMGKQKNPGWKSAPLDKIDSWISVG